MNAPTPTNGNQSLPLALDRLAELDSTPRRDPVILAPLSQKEQEEAARAVEIFRRPMRLPSLRGLFLEEPFGFRREFNVTVMVVLGPSVVGVSPCAGIVPRLAFPVTSAAVGT